MRGRMPVIVLIRIWKQLDTKYKYEFIFISLFSILVAFAEVISVGSLIPFISVLTEPELILKNTFSQFLIRNGGRRVWMHRQLQWHQFASGTLPQSARILWDVLASRLLSLFFRSRVCLAGPNA